MEIRDWAIIYASAISTFTLAWNIFNEYRKEKRRLHVEISLNFAYIDTGIGFQQISPLLSIKITNTGKVDMVINSPSFELKFCKYQGTKFFDIISMPSHELTYLMGHNTTFPKKISPGDVPIEIKYPIDTIYENVIKKYPKNFFYRFAKIRAVIYDERKKRYNSNWISLRRIESTFELYLKNNNK